MGKRLVKKIENLDKLTQLLLSHPRGLRKAEIARRLDVHRSTAAEYLDDLTVMGVPVYEPTKHQFSINRDIYQFDISLTLHESMALHLASRLLATRTDKHNPHAASAIRKLGAALEELAPLISKHLLLSANTLENPVKKRDPIYLQILETLTKAWSLGLKVHLTHEMTSGEIHDYTFSPYFIEPYAVGRTSHVIGFREPPSEIRTFKIERIRTIELLEEETYSIPESFDPSDQLRDAWGIWYAEEQTTTVKLKFKRKVAKRVQETQWHHSQELEELEDGSLLWIAKIAEPQEMVPWIRGWGPDVEVIEPPELKSSVVDSIKTLTRVYQLESLSSIPKYQMLWAKADIKTDRIHPLICHLIDVGTVANAMWRRVFTESLRNQFAKVLGCSSEKAKKFLVFLIALHDLGKAAPGFQSKYQPEKKVIEEQGLNFPTMLMGSSFYHGTATTVLLPELMGKTFQLGGKIIKDLATVIGGHHGAWPTPLDLHGVHAKQLGDHEWEDLRNQIYEKLLEIFDPPQISIKESDVEQYHAGLVLLSGYTSTADWIGSMERFFPYTEPPISINDYTTFAAEQAEKALKVLNWSAKLPAKQKIDFTSIFGFDEPRPVQSQAIALAEKLEGPSLAIIEAPTGEGKTEAALYLSEVWKEKLAQFGLYVAMPTMATSNQMFERVSTFFEDNYPDRSINPLLVHSQAAWQSNDQLPTVNISEDQDHLNKSLEAMSWFLPKKRSLLAPAGVGTVDQTFLSVLQTRHFFVRLLGLSHKTVIFDEVHAYDTYMSTLFQRLLTWLRNIGSSVVILSATLPQKTRRSLLAAYAGKSVEDIQTNYPLISWASAGEIGSVPIEKGRGKKIDLDWISRDPEAISATLEKRLSAGGCAAVICNTVGRAQEVYKQLRKDQLVAEEYLVLFHARFPMDRRNEIERIVLSRFEKAGERPSKAIVVATQVIEQSLDLDFDLMISDLAPVDLLIQRVGRLHRHQMNVRPDLLKQPQMVLTEPDVIRGIPEFGSDEYIYAPFILLRSYVSLRERNQLSLPEETEYLIEAVYSEQGEKQSKIPEINHLLEKYKSEMGMDIHEAKMEAKKRLISPPSEQRLLKIRNELLEEGSADVHQVFRAMTRLSPPSVTLVCLHRTEDGYISTNPFGRGLNINLDDEPSQKEIGVLVRRTVNISSWKIVEHYSKKEPPKGWKKHALLRNYYPLIFENGKYLIPGLDHWITFDPETGIEVVSSTGE